MCEPPVICNGFSLVKIWSDADATNDLAHEVQAINQEIRRHLELSEIEAKLREELRAGFTADEKGLTRAIQLTLEPNERELAEESFAELAQRLLGTDVATLKTSTPEPESTPEIAEQKDIFAALVEGMRVTVPNQRGKRSSELQAWLGETELAATNWRDINSGIVETMIALGRKTFVSSRGYIFPTNQSRIKGNGELYPPSAYRQLSDGDFLFLHDGASGHMQKSRHMLKELGVPFGIMRVVYRGDTFYLP